ncbi:MAG: hypothetical protein ACK5PF_07735 [bacterium]|jgi:hypothetical protein
MSEQTPETPTPETPPLDPIESQAREMGWVPREDYEAAGKDVSKWVTPEIFVARAPLFEKIENEVREKKQMRRELDVLKSSLNDLKLHAERIRQSEYNRALEELKAAKRSALAEEDLIRADEIQERIETVKEAHKATPAPTAPQPDPDITEAFKDWVQENQWYKLDEEMRELADAIGIRETRKGKAPDEVLKAVAQEVRKVFKDSHHFRNPNKDKAPAVENGNAPPPQKGNGKKYAPSETERQIAKRFVATGVFKTEDDYYAELAKMG